MTRRVVVVGLDCVPPLLAFDRYADEMPCLRSLVDRGIHGPLRSTTPPITVPAWACMTSGRDPGELGLYGFRNRIRRAYGLEVATSRDIRVKRIWDLAGDAGRRVASLFVPPSWPPAPVRGVQLSCFLTPDARAPWTFPAAKGIALSERFGPYLPDVADFRSDERDRVRDAIYAMGEQHFAMARAILTEERPDLLMMVELGPDRFHHAFWQTMDPSHPRHDPSDPFVEEGRRYYAFLDRQLGTLLDSIDDETCVLVVSDHGARALEGGIRINEWLIEHGLLVLRERPSEPVRLTHDLVDWESTRVWGEGGYYARLFFNVRGREPRGIVGPSEVDRLRREVTAGLQSLEWGAEVLEPASIYRKVRGFPPDLMVFFGDLRYRSLGTVGGEPATFAETNDSGPDGCNHDWDGVFVLAGPDVPHAPTALEDLSIYDVTRTVLSILEVPAAHDLLGIDRAR